LSKTVKCRTISEGYGEGEAIVCKQAFGFNHGVDLETGRIKEIGHELEGQSIKGKVFVFPKAKGSTGGSCVVYQLGLAIGAPAAIINASTETIVAVGAILSGLPVVDRLEEDAFDLIQDGDYIKVDANNGVVKILKAGER
jgi:predicted aconitase with swiveling domain